MKNITSITISDVWKKPQPHTSYLLLTELHLTPPHCSLIVNQNWFSLNYNTCKKQVNFDTLYKTLIKKQIPALFLEINTPLDLSTAISVFNNYEKVNFKQNITCITPIKQVFNHHQINCPSEFLLYEMIDWLYINQFVTNASAVFFEDKNYVLNHYTRENLNTIHYVETQ